MKYASNSFKRYTNYTNDYLSTNQPFFEIDHLFQFYTQGYYILKDTKRHNNFSCSVKVLRKTKHLLESLRYVLPYEWEFRLHISSFKTLTFLQGNIWVYFYILPTIHLNSRRGPTNFFSNDWTLIISFDATFFNHNIKNLLQTQHRSSYIIILSNGTIFFKV